MGKNLFARGELVGGVWSEPLARRGGLTPRVLQCQKLFAFAPKMHVVNLYTEKNKKKHAWILRTQKIGKNSTRNFEQGGRGLGRRRPPGGGAWSPESCSNKEGRALHLTCHSEARNLKKWKKNNVKNLSHQKREKIGLVEFGGEGGDWSVSLTERGGMVARPLQC